MGVIEMNTWLNNKIRINKSLLATAVFMATAFSFPLQAYESYQGNPVIVDQFIQLDADGDGLITRQEVTAQPEFTRGMEVSVSGGFDMGDFNSDGMLDWPEFLANEEEIPME
jgi:hypothetical protein